jgi:hypothetical protein
MSTFLPLVSVCGAKSAMVDVYDIELNRDGIICCDNCQSILICRNAWNDLYKENK